MKRLPIVAATMLASGACVFSSALARAQTVEGPLSSHHTEYESPQHFAFEFRVSPYKPEIDSDPALAGQTPYASVFGTTPQVLIALEFDWQALRIPHVGTLGPGVGVGYTPGISGNAQFQTEHNGSLVSGESTSLEIFPVYAVAVLRADVVWRELHVPLVPYAKIGPAVGFWRASNTLGTSHALGSVGLGESYGTQVAVGLGFNMNVLDAYAARNFDETLGVNGTYLFAEWSRMDLDGLWFQSDPLRVGSTYWTFGLAFEF